MFTSNAFVNAGYGGHRQHPQYVYPQRMQAEVKEHVFGRAHVKLNFILPTPLRSRDK